MKRGAEVLFSGLIVASFFMPWVTYIEMITSEPINGISFMLLCFFLMINPMMLITGVSLLLTISFSLVITFNLTSHMNLNKVTVKKWIFLLSIGAFFIQIISHTFAGIMKGKEVLESLSYQLSFVTYGVYATLLSALCLLLTNKIKD